MGVPAVSENRAVPEKALLTRRRSGNQMAPARRATAPRGRRRPVRRGDRIALREVRASDAADVTRHRLAMLREMSELPAGALRRYGPIFAQWFRDQLRAGNVWGVVAESADGRLVAGGLLWLQPRLPSPRFPQRQTPYVFSVYTEPSARRQGIGRRIVERLIDRATASGYPRVELHATEIGRALYERLGFRSTNQMRLEIPRPRPGARRRPTR
jgi:GNAT superfamily N-acetyltransferase